MKCCDSIKLIFKSQYNLSLLTLLIYDNYVYLKKVTADQLQHPTAHYRKFIKPARNTAYSRFNRAAVERSSPITNLIWPYWWKFCMAGRQEFLNEFPMKFQTAVEMITLWLSFLQRKLESWRFEFYRATIFIALIIKSACYRGEWIERTTRFVDLVRGSEGILRSRDARMRKREKEESGKSKGGRGRSLGTLHGGGFRARIPVSTATVMVIAPSRAIPLAPMQFTRSITPY